MNDTIVAVLLVTALLLESSVVGEEIHQHTSTERKQGKLTVEGRISRIMHVPRCVQIRRLSNTVTDTDTTNCTELQRLISHLK